MLAVKYNENKQTTVNMSGTAIAPRVMGKADVEFKQGRTNVRLEMESFGNPQSLGGFYTSYILWAVAPEGQAENLMELPIRSKFKIESTTKFQTFGLIITAEPHSMVELPSPMIVAENTLRNGTEGMITTSRIEYSGDPGTFYTIFAQLSGAERRLQHAADDPGRAPRCRDCAAGRRRKACRYGVARCGTEARHAGTGLAAVAQRIRPSP